MTPGIDKPGFIDNDDGANIRTGRAELQGVALTARPRPLATRVFEGAASGASVAIEACGQAIGMA